MKIAKKHRAELQFWRGMVAELTKDCCTPQEREEALIRVCTEKTFPRYKESLSLTDNSFGGQRILDVGCGPHCGIIGFTDCEKYGLDPLMEDYRSLGYPLDRHDVQYVAASSEQMPYPDFYFDAVLCVNALDHVDNVEATVREIARVLKVGGRFLGQLNFHAKPSTTEPNCLTDDVIRRIFAKYGLSIAVVRYQCSIHDYTEDRYYYEAVKIEQPCAQSAQPAIATACPPAPAGVRHVFDEDRGAWKLQDDNYLLFRFVPTLRCNYRCEYCFLSHDMKAQARETMFDEHTPQEWVDAMRHFSGYDVGFYGWGGEPFLLDGVYDVLKGWCAYDFVQPGNRLDTNMYFTDKIVARCPTPKIKLNCSWHLHYDSFESIVAKVKKLQAVDMVGMVNFVASPQNMDILTHQYHMTLDELVDRFADIGVFLNVAADFNIVHTHRHSLSRSYQRMILRHVSLEEWNQQRDIKAPSLCTAHRRFFTLYPNGDICICLSQTKVGNFFTGELHFPEFAVCNEACPSLVTYPFRVDNPFPYRQHLDEYVERNRAHHAHVLRQESYAGGNVPPWEKVKIGLKSGKSSLLRAIGAQARKWGWLKRR